MPNRSQSLPLSLPHGSTNPSVSMGEKPKVSQDPEIINRTPSPYWKAEDYISLCGYGSNEDDESLVEAEDDASSSFPIIWDDLNEPGEEALTKEEDDASSCFPIIWPDLNEPGEEALTEAEDDASSCFPIIWPNLNEPGEEAHTEAEDDASSCFPIIWPDLNEPGEEDLTEAEHDASSCFPIISVDENRPEEAEEAQERFLAGELIDFQRRGFLIPHNSDQPSNDDRMLDGQQYGIEAMRKYALFFSLIPQNPHYQGLLQGSVAEGTKRVLYLSLWYNLVNLTEMALSTTCSTKQSDIEDIMGQARDLDTLGFNVRHLIARLKEPMLRKRDLQLAKKGMESAKRKNLDMEIRRDEIIVEVEAELNRMKKKLRTVEQHQAMIGEMDEMIAVAEAYLRAKETDVKLFGNV